MPSPFEIATKIPDEVRSASIQVIYILYFKKE